MPYIDHEISGIKCDNERCDYSNEDVDLESYPEWVNKPCPKCGSNLLTEKDYRLTQLIIAKVEYLNAMVDISKLATSDESFHCQVELDGSGTIKEVNYSKQPNNSSPNN